MKWNVYLTKKARKQIAKLPVEVKAISDEALEDLKERGVLLEEYKTKKTGDGEYSLRLNYRYRMRYRVVEKERTVIIEVFYVGHRREAYR
ncbi:MAG: type II toxin-antitoxin system RelE family toxin [Thermodesulfobacteriota bacterium]